MKMYFVVYLKFYGKVAFSINFPFLLDKFYKIFFAVNLMILIIMSVRYNCLPTGLGTRILVGEV